MNPTNEPTFLEIDLSTLSRVNGGDRDGETWEQTLGNVGGVGGSALGGLVGSRFGAAGVGAAVGNVAGNIGGRAVGRAIDNWPSGGPSGGSSSPLPSLGGDASTNYAPLGA